MKREKTIIIFLAVFVIAGGFFSFQSFFKKENVVKIEPPVEKNYSEINDEIAGIFFRVSKNFDRMTAQELQLRNPVFMYGFSAKSDRSAYCVISQTKKDKPGGIKAVDLRDGVLDQMKKSYPDANLESAEIVKVGENDNKGVKVKISYTDNKVPMSQWEVVGITDKMAIFSLCTAPKAVLELYKDDFNLFLNSLRINPA